MSTRPSLIKCFFCEDTGWTCEAHPDQPSTGPHACTCGGAGAPCPRCNAASADKPPRLPKGFEPDEGSRSRMDTRGGSSLAHVKRWSYSPDSAHPATKTT